MRFPRSLALTLVLGLAAGCPRIAVDYEEFEQACASYCAKRFECMEQVPWDAPNPPLDADQCTQRCAGRPPENPECLAPKAAYSECLGALTCDELAVFYDDPFSEASRPLCFAEFEEASYCE